jgi:hypothetical protein
VRARLLVARPLDLQGCACAPDAYLYAPPGSLISMTCDARESAIDHACEWDGTSRDVYILGVDEPGAVRFLQTCQGRVDSFALRFADDRSRSIDDGVRQMFAAGGDLLRHAQVTFTGVQLDLYLLMRPGASPPGLCDFDFCLWPDRLQAHGSARRTVSAIFDLSIDLAETAGAEAVVVSDEGFDFRPGSGICLWRAPARRAE